MGVIFWKVFADHMTVEIEKGMDVIGPPVGSIQRFGSTLIEQKFFRSFADKIAPTLALDFNGLRIGDT